jgi:hypothetical protein
MLPSKTQFTYYGCPFSLLLFREERYDVIITRQTSASERT